MIYRNVLLVSFMCSLAEIGWGQATPWVLPPIQSHRRADMSYMDSLAQLGKKQYYLLSNLPQTARNDTLRFKTLYYLGQLYKIWYGRRDSTLYFGQELMKQARQRRNLFYEVNGKVIVADYYRSGEINTPQALRLNLDILDQIPPANTYYDVTRYRVYINLSSLYTLARDFASAVRYLTLAQTLLTNDLPYATAAISHGFRIEIHQHLGYVYNQQGRFPDSEAHYLKAEQLLVAASSLASRGYIYDDLAELYLKFGNYAKALPYAKRAEVIWNQLKVSGESKGWGTLSCVYAGLKQDELAHHYAQCVLRLPKPSNFVLEQAYSALHQVYERRKDWANSSTYYKKYIAVRDSIAINQRTVELVAIQKQVEFDRINAANRQAQQLQTQRMLTIQKQAEINQLRSNVQAGVLHKKAQLSEQQRRFDNERASAALQQQQAAQTVQQQLFEQRTLQQENQSQRNQIAYLTSSFLFIVGILTLLLYSAQLRKRKAEAELRLTRERKEADTRIIQTQETERQRIAADLHDDLGGTLATIRQRLSDIRQHLHDPQAARELDALEPLIQKSGYDLRRIAHNLMPPEFARIGLRHALEQLVGNQPLQPTRFSFIVSGVEQPLPVDLELNAYRIISELIQNIHKHAQARRAAVQLLYRADRLTITVDDDGLGNRLVTNPTNSVGIGLKNSTLRAEYIGATLWREASEAGTLVVLDIPYPSPMYATHTNLPNTPD